VGKSADGTQGTGAVEVNQDGVHGGGISYNGDNNPSFVSGETEDHITFYRMNNGVRSEVFHYPYHSDSVNFNGGVTASSFHGDGSNLTGIDAVITQNTEPTGQSTGALWFKTDVKILHIHNGTDFVPVYEPPFSATGANNTYDFGDYKVDVFTSSGTLNVLTGGLADIFIVGAGGAAGAMYSGGGGAGELLWGENIQLTSGAYSVTVGAGGTHGGGTGGHTNCTSGSNMSTNGGDSSFGTYVAYGGGAGGTYNTSACTHNGIPFCNGRNGGSGGGPALAAEGAPAGNSTKHTYSGFTSYGNVGAQGGGTGGDNCGCGGTRSGGSGGGAGGAGRTSCDYHNGNCGNGSVGGVGIDMSSFFGTAVGESGWFASGGSGCMHSGNTSNHNPAPIGGGGDGVSSDSDSRRNGQANTGGGGGGCEGYSTTSAYGHGGSGIVIVRYAV